MERNGEVIELEDDSNNTLLTGLLVLTMNLVGDNDVLRDFIDKVINNASS